jgi:hypothetical protein
MGENRHVISGEVMLATGPSPCADACPLKPHSIRFCFHETSKRGSNPGYLFRN